MLQKLSTPYLKWDQEKVSRVLPFEGIDLHHYYTAIALSIDIIMPLRFWLQDYCANSFFSV